MVGCGEEWSERALRALAVFGLTTVDVGLEDRSRAARARGARARRLAERVVASLNPARGGRIAVVVGPSGAGKSTVLRAIERAALRRGARVVRSRPGGWCRSAGVRVIDAVAGEDLVESLRRLAGCGLGDARAAVSPVRGLSEGERARLALARAMTACEAAGAPVVLVLDEPCAGLDEPTALAVGRAVRRFVEARPGRSAVAASVGEGGAIAAMGAEVRVRLPPAWIHAGAGGAPENAAPGAGHGA